jgi:predicted HicB family RNase H-like nuclease
MPTTKHTEHITARIDRETAERLVRTAAEEDRSISSVVRRALRRHLSERQACVRVPESHERSAAA